MSTDTWQVGLIANGLALSYNEHRPNTVIL